MLKSSCHCAIGNRCFADRALIVARTLFLEASAPSIAILNWLIKCLLVVDSIVYHHLGRDIVSTMPSPSFGGRILCPGYNFHI